MKTSLRPDTSLPTSRRAIAIAMVVGTFTVGLCLSSCSTARRGDPSEIGSGNAQYPIGDTGLNQQYEEQNRMVRQLGL